MPSFKRVSTIWRKQWYTFMQRFSLQADFYMTHEDQVFVVNVVVIDLTHETMVTNVISQPTSVVAKLITIVKICKYRRFHERHHFISMAMDMHKTFRCDMDCFIREGAYLFHDRRLKGHLSLSFCI